MAGEIQHHRLAHKQLFIFMKSFAWILFQKFLRKTLANSVGEVSSELIAHNKQSIWGFSTAWFCLDVQDNDGT